MNYSLHDYVKVYRKFITEEVCDAAIAELDQIIFEPHKFYSHIHNTSTSQGNDPEYYLKGAASNKEVCLLYTSPSPRDRTRSRMPSSA